MFLKVSVKLILCLSLHEDSSLCLMKRHAMKT